MLVKKHVDYLKENAHFVANNVSVMRDVHFKEILFLEIHQETIRSLFIRVRFTEVYALWCVRLGEIPLYHMYVCNIHILKRKSRIYQAANSS